MMQGTDQNIQWYQSRFDVFEQSLNGAKSTSVHAMRRGAIAAVQGTWLSNDTAGGMALHQYSPNHQNTIPADSTQ